MRHRLQTLPGRALCLGLACWMPLVGCDPSSALSVSAGAPEYQQLGQIAVPGGRVNAAGGNLQIARDEISVDALLGRHEIRAVYQSATGAWHWSFQSRWDGSVFVDPAGSPYAMALLADGAAVPGSVYRRVDAARVETRGGRVYHFGAAGRLARVAWRGQEYPQTRYDWSPDRLAISSCSQAEACQPIFDIELDAEGRPLALLELRGGRRVEWHWDALGRLVEARGPLQAELGHSGHRYEYLAGTTLLSARISPDGERVEYLYQPGRRLSEVIQVGEESPVHHFRYLGRDDQGLYATLHTDPTGALTRYLFDSRRRLRRVEREATSELSHVAWEALRPVRLELPDGSAYEYGYRDDELASVVQPSGNRILIEYEAGAVNPRDPRSAAIRRVVDALGVVVLERYDAQGRPVESENGEGERSGRGYALGSIVDRLLEPTGLVHELPRFGLHGHWTRREGPSPDDRALDPIGNLRVPGSLARGGGILDRRYDSDRRLSGLSLAATAEGRVVETAELRLRRRADGRLLAVERPLGNDHEWDYDAIGRLVALRERSLGQWHETRFEYDAAGRMTARERPNGMREEWHYGPYGRVELHRALRHGVLEAEARQSWEAGRLASRFDSVRGTLERYAYDPAGRLARVDFGYGEGLELEWDERSRLVRETFSLPGEGPIVTLDYDYDLADRRIAIRVDGVAEVEHVFERGRLARTQTGNGLTRGREYDPDRGLLVGLRTVDSQGHEVERTRIEQRAETAPARSQVSVWVDTPLASTREEYWLGLGSSPARPDSRVGKQVFGWRQGSGELRRFDYDVLGNRLGQGFAYASDGGRLLRAPRPDSGAAIEYAWDDAGYATSRDRIPIEWTATGRLASYGSLAIRWDLAGRPVSWEEGGVERSFALFGGRVQSDPASGGLIGLDLGELFVGFGGERRYRHPDLRGNVSGVSDEAGAWVSHYHYAPYGLHAVYGPEDDGVSFVGRTRLGELALLGQRVYDAAAGRFLSPDPVFQLVNAYAYAGGNPLWFSDPGGAESGPSGIEVALDAAKVAGALGALLLLGPEASAVAAVLAVLAITVAAIGLAVTLSAWYRSSVGLRVGEGGAMSDATSLTELQPALVPELSFSAPPPAVCAPTRIGAVPGLGPWLWLVIPLQLAAGVALLRARRRREE